MSTDKHFEFGSQTSTTSSASYPATYGRSLMADVTSGGSTDSGSNQSDNGTQMTDPGDDRAPVWQLAVKALVILLVIFGLVLGGRWVWSNYSSDDSATTEETTAAVEEQEPIPINIGQETAPEPEQTAVDGDIPALGPADHPIALTIGAAILAATLYRFSHLAHQPNRR